MHDQPEPTEEEREQGAERLQEEDAMRGPGHDDPEGAQSGDEEVDGDAEELGYAADEAYERLTGIVMPDLGLPAPPREPLGTYLDFDDDDTLAERFPRLWDRFRS